MNSFPGVGLSVSQKHRVKLTRENKEVNGVKAIETEVGINTEQEKVRNDRNGTSRKKKLPH
jgi:hypothetical protein